ncbi:ABC transporter permease [Candidatus Villigracilis saccharophilus]|uniref:ABC transporter permease n=1 Tax=Candidatus Villigracilis saccharophilus TaxID=3140684 RepID=UPI003134FF34|nr:ABC transporter permease [Anaerolineales bacterium]
MKFLDLLRLIFGNLSRRKARVALTAIGVVIGTAAVVILVSLAIGLQKSATDSLYGIGDLTQIDVMPTYGGGGFGGGGGGPFISQAVGEASQLDQPVLLTNSALEQLRGIPGVKAVIPRDYLNAGVIVRYQRLEGGMNIIGVATDDLSNLGLEASQGTTALSKGSIVIGVMTPNNFYDPRLRPGQEPPPPPDLIDQQIQMIVLKYDQNGNETRKTISLRVAGIINETGGEPDYSVYLPLELTKSLNEWANGYRINYNKDGYSQVIVKVEDANQALDIAEQITAMGFQAITPQSFLQGINSFFVVLQVIFGGVGAIALLVAAIGIANTMAMSILERTREIGLMKAVGATNRDVLSIFLGEAAGIGFIGGLGGIVIGWLAAQGMNVLALAYLAGQASQQGGAPPSVAVYTPIWLPIFALVFSTLIGMLSGLYPALRAATMIPVQALKYE